jgi:hypothetical protein
MEVGREMVCHIGVTGDRLPGNRFTKNTHGIESIHHGPAIQPG